MTVWRKLDNGECYAVAIYNYTGTGSVPHLPLEVGELVSLERETADWYWGRSLRKDAVGAFPKSYVVQRHCYVDRCGDSVLASAGGGGVVHEIAVTLREWLHIWKTLYVTNGDKFKFMEVSMRALLQLRAQAASGALPQDQLRRVARTALFTIDKGNRALGMELSVRTAGGELVDPLSISTYKLNQLHEEANERISKNMESTPSPTATASTARAYAICMRVLNFVCRTPAQVELSAALHDASARVTEPLLFRYPNNHLQQQVLFTDLNSDVKREKLFLVCYVVRIGPMELQNTDNRRSSIAASVMSTSNSNSGVTMRRPWGVACCDITRHLANQNWDKHILVPFYPCEKEKMETVLRQVMANQRELKDAKHSQGLWVTLRLVDGDLKQIREENPHLIVGNTAIARKMGFPEVILPGDARNDLYVTIVSGAFSKGGGKSSERNIEMTARVVDRHGKVLPGVISMGAGVPLVDEYTSLVYYHEDKPRWLETFKVVLNIETFKEAHLVFLTRHRSSNEAKDRSERHFALCYLRLMQREGTTTADGSHELCVYKIETKRGSSPAEAELEAMSACVAFPSRRADLPAGSERGFSKGPLTLLPRDHLIVNTKLCSTKLTHREEIVGVLKWSAQQAEGTLRAALARLLRVPSEEIVKFLPDILDAAFSILTQVEEDQEGFTENSYAVLILECLLHVISLVGDHKYQHFQPVLHVYIDTSFCDALAYEKLISVIVWVITTADSGEGDACGANMKRLLQCMKCLECLMRIVARSRQLRSALGDKAADADFKYQFESLLEALVWLMRCGDHALTCQGAALKYLPHAVPHLAPLGLHVDLCSYIVQALSALEPGRLSKQRVLCLLELVRGPLSRQPASRALLLPHAANTVKHLLRSRAERTREAALKSRSVDKAARLLGTSGAAQLRDNAQSQHTTVELCIELLGEIMTLLSRDDIGPVAADRGELARRLLPTVIHTAASMLQEREAGPRDSKDDECSLRRIVCVLLDMVRQMSIEQYRAVVRALEAEELSGGSLVADALALLPALLQNIVFKQHWADMQNLQAHVMMHALKLLSITLCERLKAADESDPEAATSIHWLWRDWFSAATALATSPALQFEALPAQARRRQQVYGDVRRACATALADMWFSLDEHKRAFVPWLVGPLLEVSFLRDDEVRNTTVPVFFDMMQTEFNSAGDGEGQLKEIESELIDKIDVLAERGSGDVEWRARFVSLCGALCRALPPTAPLRAPALALVAAAARQLDTLLQYRTAALRSATPFRMHLTSRVLHFYAQIERPHMYIRYVHKLAKMHEDANQWAEAGLCLQLHAKLLSWERDPLPSRLLAPAGTDVVRHGTHRQLKEALYIEAAEMLNRGNQWELAVELVKELVSVCEQELIGYGRLAELHQQLAQLYTRMLRNPRCHPGYYRVLFRGQGFPDHLNVPHGFVYRANDFEQLQEFRERLLDEWPGAELLLTLDAPSEELSNSPGQYLQINAVRPVMGDRMKRLSGKPVSEQILEYYKHNNVEKFVFDRPFHRPEELLEGSKEDLSNQNEFATRWLERTELEITDTLPGILRWFPVVSQRTYWVSPVEAAVESLQETNRALKCLILATRAPDAPLSPLTMRLTGILDAAVQGGIDNYEKAFLNPAYEARHPECAPLLQRLRDLIADQVPLLKLGLAVQEARMPADLASLHAHLLSRYHRLQQHVSRRYGSKTCDIEPSSPEVQLRGSTSVASVRESVDTTISSRVSDISTNDSSSISKFFNSAINPLARNSNSGVTKFGTLNSPKKRDKRGARKSEIGSASSQWYTSQAIVTSSSSAPGKEPPTPPTPLRELRQELVVSRPSRAEAEREKRASQRASLLSAPQSNRDSIGTTDSNQDDEEPPPLPEKSSHRLELDSENNNLESNPTRDSNPLPARYSYDTVWTPRRSFIYNSMVQRKTGATDKAPTPPPKKKNVQNSHNSSHC